MKNLKRKLGQWMIKRGITLTGDALAVTDPAVMKALDIPDDATDAVVEVDDQAIAQWTPNQHGGIVVVEPDIMRAYRQGKL